MHSGRHTYIVRAVMHTNLKPVLLSFVRQQSLPVGSFLGLLYNRFKDYYRVLTIALVEPYNRTEKSLYRLKWSARGLVNMGQNGQNWSP